MNVLVIYDSQYGNTEKVARAIASRLEPLGSVRMVSAGDPAAIDIAGVDLLVIGGPTQGHGASRKLRDVLERLPSAELREMRLATFDTRLHWPELLAGSAAHTIAKSGERHGAYLAVPPESFFVSSGEGPLVDGELERAGAWADTLVSKLVGGTASKDVSRSTP